VDERKIELRQRYARMYSQKVRGGKFFVDRSADAVQAGNHDDALADLEIAVSFFPDSAQLAQLLELVKQKREKGRVKSATTRPPSEAAE
jgi:hypothetical protein